MRTSLTALCLSIGLIGIGTVANADQSSEPKPAESNAMKQGGMMGEGSMMQGDMMGMMQMMSQMAPMMIACTAMMNSADAKGNDTPKPDTKG